MILPVHNRGDVTARFASDLNRQPHGGIQLVLVDDGSTDGTAERVCGAFANTHVIRGNGSFWWAQGVQEGLDLVARNNPGTDDVVLICNDDVRLPDDFIANGAQFIADHPNTLLGAQFRESNESDSEETGVFFNDKDFSFTTPRDPAKINCLSTRGLFLTWKAVQAIGPFRPGILPHYGSDLEWTYRAHRKGFDLRTHPSVWLTPDLATTGLRDPDDVYGLGEGWNFMFSRRSTGNLPARLGMITLMVPLKRRPRLLITETLLSLKFLVKAGLSRPRSPSARSG